MTILDPTDPTPIAPAVAPETGPSGDDARVRRPEPARDGPLRGSFSAAGSAPTAAAAGDIPPAPSEATVSESVAHAVRLGYDVIGENIRQGREAAGRFRQGEYNVRDVPHDLNQLSIRLLTLTRELSSTSFDLLDRLLRDPRTPGSTPRAATDHQPPAFYPAPSAPKPTPPTGPAFTCVFSGPGKAILKQGVLSRPDKPTTPASLTVTPLASLDPAVKTIVGVTFAASADGEGVVALATIPADQPAGVYSGVIFAPESQAPLGMLTIEVV